jgi:hypothetical protein
MALKTFTATRAPQLGDGKILRAWHLSASVAAIVNFCDGTSATPIFQVQIPNLASASEVYGQAGVVFPNGLHIEIVSGTFTRGAIDI